MFCSNAFSQPVKFTSGQWLEDLTFYRKEMEKVHINPYHKTSKEAFDKFVKDFSDRIPNMTDNQIITEFARLTALIGDGHTALNIFGMHGQNTSEVKKFNFHFFPLRFFQFNDGLYLTGAGPEYKNLIGRKLISINCTKTEDIISLIKPLVSNDNEYTILQQFPFYMITAEYLSGLGISDDPANVNFNFDYNSSIKIKPIDLSKLHGFEEFDFKNGTPLYLQHDEKNYWFEYISDKKILYINYKRVLPDANESMKNFITRMEEFVRSHDIDKTIIDIRFNDGGDNGTCQPFVNYINSNKIINVRGKLFTVIGRKTFSAASYLTTKLEFNTNSIFVGEPTGAMPNHFGDNRPLIIPNTGIEIRLSSIYWQNSFVLDLRTSTEPDIATNINSQDYFSGKDPALDAIIKYDGSQNKNSASSEILLGKYIFNPMKYIEIKKDNKELIFEIRQKDFVGRDVTFISTPLYMGTGNTYTTGIAGLNIIAESEPFKINYRGYEMNIPRAGTDFKTPSQLLDDGKVEEAIIILRNLKSNAPANIELSERNINGMGYELVNKKNLPAALEIFKLNVEFFPDSFNTYDSLGETYLALGNSELARQNYEKSVQLNPGNENGKKVLEVLKYGNK